MLLNTASFKIISIQEKNIFTTGFFNDTFLVKTAPMKLYFIFPLEVPKTDFIDFRTYAHAIKYVQHEYNTCVLSSISLVSDMFDGRENVAEEAFDS